MSWCDMLASVPTAGFRLTPLISSGDSYIDAWRSIMAEFYADGKQTFNVDQYDANAFGFNTEQGFKYGADAEKIFVKFNHRMKAVPVSGSTPRLELLSSARPYSELLPEVFDRLLDATLKAPLASTRKIMRIGVVSETFVSDEDLPPGIKKLIDFLGAPWGALDDYNMRVTARVGQADGWYDTCTHSIVRADGADSLTSLTFDWGRHYETSRPVDANSLRSLSNHCQEAALRYFEELGEGSRFDESLS